MPAPARRYADECVRCHVPIERGLVLEGLVWVPDEQGQWYHRSDRDIEMGFIPQRYGLPRCVTARPVTLRDLTKPDTCGITLDMKITVAPDGAISFDVPTDDATVDVAAALIRALRTSADRITPDPFALVDPLPVAKPEPRVRGKNKLSPKLPGSATCLTVQGHDPSGTTAEAVASALGIDPVFGGGLPAGQLVRHGSAYRVTRGRYTLVPKRGR